MKKNIAFTLLLTTWFLQSEETVQNCALVVDGKLLPCEYIVSLKEVRSCIEKHDLETFKQIEAKFANYRFRIFNVWINGFPLSQKILFSLYDEYDWYNPGVTQKKSDAFLDYILSVITKEELNQCMLTNFICRRWYGSAVAIAALNSPRALKKILNHKDFDPTSFLEGLADENDDTSMTLEQCVQILESKSLYEQSSNEREKAGILLAILKNNPKLHR
jgi:hypothetical protein